MVEHRGKEALLAAGARVTARHADRGLAAAHAVAHLQAARAEATGPADQADAIVDRHVGERGVEGDLRTASGGTDDDPRRLEVHQRPERAHVVRLRELAVEVVDAARPGVEDRVVEHQVAVDLLEAGRAHARDELGEVLDHELRVAAAAQHQVAVQHAFSQHAAQPRLGAPAVVGPEQRQSGIGGDQLDRRRGIQRQLCVVGDERLRTVERQRDCPDLLRREPGVVKPSLDRPARRRRFGHGGLRTRGAARNHREAGNGHGAGRPTS